MPWFWWHQRYVTPCRMLSKLRLTCVHTEIKIWAYKFCCIRRLFYPSRFTVTVIELHMDLGTVLCSNCKNLQFYDQKWTLRKNMWILNNKSSAQSIVKLYNLLLLLYLHRGAEHYQANSSITESALNSLHCLQITCRGLETSLAECHIKVKSRGSNEGFVSLQCHENLRG